MDNRSDKARSPETETGCLSRERALALMLLVATALAVYLCYQLTRPFLPALAWAFALAVVAHPLHNWLERRLRRANVAAGLAVGLVAVAISRPHGISYAAPRT
jgi:predicted PurR-regulated permease PerM